MEEESVYRNRYAVVYKAPNVALYGKGAKPEYYVTCWGEEVPWQEYEGWEDEDWARFYKEQDEERDSAYAELERLRAQN
jgi:hypothetical protein